MSSGGLEKLGTIELNMPHWEVVWSLYITYEEKASTIPVFAQLFKIHHARQAAQEGLKLTHFGTYKAEGCIRECFVASSALGREGFSEDCCLGVGSNDTSTLCGAH